MTRLKHREPATNLPSASASSTSAPSRATQKSAAQQSAAQKNTAKKSTAQKNTAKSAFTPSSKSGDSSADGLLGKGLPEKGPSKRSRLRRLGRAIAHYPNLAQMLIFMMAIGGTSLVLLGLLFRDAWSDRHNNTAIISAILKMELAREDFRVIESSPERVVTHTFATLEPHVEADGWTWINRFGNTITYGKQDQRMIASCSPYSPLYVVCDLGEIPK